MASGHVISGQPIRPRMAATIQSRHNDELWLHSGVMLRRYMVPLHLRQCLLGSRSRSIRSALNSLFDGSSIRIVRAKPTSSLTAFVGLASPSRRRRLSHLKCQILLIRTSQSIFENSLLIFTIPHKSSYGVGAKMRITVSIRTPNLWPT